MLGSFPVTTSSTSTASSSSEAGVGHPSVGAGGAAAPAHPSSHEGVVLGRYPVTTSSTSTASTSSEAGVGHPSVGAGGAAAPAHPSLSTSTSSSSTEDDGYSTLYFANVTALGKKAWAHIVEQQTRHSYDFMGFVETHIGETLKQKWSGSFKAQKMKSIFNLARSSGRGSKEATRNRANEGGEVFLARQHLQVHKFPIEAEHVSDLCADGHTSFDGFLPVTIHLQGYTIVLVLCYLHPSVGVGGSNAARLTRLGAFLRSLRLPWLCVGDFNIAPEKLRASKFLQRVQGQIHRAPCDYTCSTSGGKSLIDYVIAGPGSGSFLVDVTADHDVPWSPHCALKVRLRQNCKQLETRSLITAPKLPQSSRPGTLPTAGSKSSISRVEHANRAALAREKAVALSDELFGDLFENSNGEEPFFEARFEPANLLADESLLEAAFEPDPWDEEDPWAEETCFRPSSVGAEVVQGIPQAGGGEGFQVSISAPAAPPESGNISQQPSTEPPSVSTNPDFPAVEPCEKSDEASPEGWGSPSFHIPSHRWVLAQTNRSFISSQSNVDYVSWAPIQESIAYQIGGPYIPQVSAKYAQWIACVEEVISAHHDLPTPSISRSTDPSLKNDLVKQAMTFRDAPLRDKVSNWWARVLQVSLRVQRHRQRKSGFKQLAHLCQLGVRLAGELPEGAHSCLPPEEGLNWDLWLQCLRHDFVHPQLSLDQLICIAQKASRRATSKAMQESLKDFRDWIVSASAQQTTTQLQSNPL